MSGTSENLKDGPKKITEIQSEDDAPKLEPTTPPELTPPALPASVVATTPLPPPTSEEFTTPSTVSTPLTPAVVQICEVLQPPEPEILNIPQTSKTFPPPNLETSEPSLNPYSISSPPLSPEIHSMPTTEISPLTSLKSPAFTDPTLSEILTDISETLNSETTPRNPLEILDTEQSLVECYRMYLSYSRQVHHLPCIFSPFPPTDLSFRSTFITPEKTITLWNIKSPDTIALSRMASQPLPPLSTANAPKPFISLLPAILASPLLPKIPEISSSLLPLDVLTTSTPPPTPENSSNFPWPPPPPPSSPEPPEPPSFIDSDFIEIALRETYPDIKVNDLNLEAAVEIGDHYLSHVFRANVCTNQGPFNLIIKCSSEPHSESVEFVSANEYNVREIQFYHSILPILQRNLSNDSNLKPSIPQYYFSINKVDKDAIVFQDMKPLGFRTIEGSKNGLDKQHCIIVVQELAKFHALSIKLRINNPEIFEKEIIENCAENMYNEKNRELFTALLNTSLDACAKTVLEFFPFRYRGIAIVMDGLIDHVFDMMCDIFNFSKDPSDKILVLNHGDLWCNNILFKYQSTDSESPVACCMLDFQVCKCGPPVLDLLYFLYMSTVKEIRQNHMHELLNVYFDQVNKRLLELGVSYPLPKNMFYTSVTEIQGAIREFALYGFVSTCFVMPFALASSADYDDPNYPQVSEIERLCRGKLFRSRFRDVLDAFDDMGLFLRCQEIVEELEIQNEASESYKE